RRQATAAVASAAGRARCCSDRAVATERRDLLLRVAELLQDLVGVLAELRWMTPDRRRSAREAHGDARRAHTTCGGVVDLRDEPEMPHDGIGEHLVERVDRTDRDIRFAQTSNDLRLREGLHTSFDDRDDLPTVCDPLRVVGEALVLEQLLEVERTTKALEERVVRDADVDVPVARTERLVRDDRRMHVPFGPRHRAVGEEARGLAREQRDLPADHRRVDDLPLAGAIARVQGGGDRERREHARDHVGLRHADHDRIAARLAGETHDPAHPLNDEVVRGPRAAWAVLAEAADMAEDRSRIDSSYTFIGKAQARERPRAEVLDDDIALLDEAFEHALPVRVLEIERDAALVAIDGEVVRRDTFDARRRPLTRLIAGAWHLDLDDVRAVVAEHERAVRARERPREIEDAYPVERAGGWRSHGRRVPLRRWRSCFRSFR